MLGLLKRNTLARNTLWMFIGNGTRVFIQAVYFVFIARSLGPEGYGAFVAVGALTIILSQFSGLGAWGLLIKHVSTDKTSFPYYWGKVLLSTFVFGVPLVGVALVVALLVLPDSVPIVLVLVVGVADILFGSVLGQSALAYQAFERLGRTASLQVLLSLLRLAAVVVMAAFVASPTALDWGLLYLLTAAIAALVSVWLVHRELGKPKLVLSSVTVELKEGFYFAWSLFMESVYNDVDKPMVARLSTLQAAGIYAAAYRLLDVTFTPVRSLLAAAYSRFFRHGASGIQGSLGFAKVMMPFAWAYAMLAGVALYTGAPLLPQVLGPDYESTVEAVRWLSLIPLLRAAHYFAADSLTGAGFQGLRTGIQMSVACSNVAMNAWLIPLYSWKGAALASIASDFLLVLGLWAAVWHVWRRRKL